MALLATVLESSLDQELNQVSDPESRYLAARKILDRFLRSLPLGSTISSLFSELCTVITDLDNEQRQLKKSEMNFLKQTHVSSTAYLINRRETELSDKVREYCEAKINEINLAKPVAASQEAKVIIEKHVTIRPGLETVPNFVKKIDASKATSVEYLNEMISNLNNEIIVKEKIKSDLIQNNVTNDRIEKLSQDNEQLMIELATAKSKRRVWKVAQMTDQYLKTINNTEKLVKKSETIKMFLSGMGDDDHIDDKDDHCVAISDPVDSQRAKNAMELIKDFGIMIKQGDYHSAAQLAVSNDILQSIHSFRRITETKTESAITAGLWFATVTFKSGTRCSREFILDSLKLCYESGMADDIIPNWHSYGIFTPHRKIAKWLEKCEQYAFACQIYMELELYQQCADLLIRRKQYHQLATLYKQKHISHSYLLNHFYENPTNIIGHALHFTGNEPIGQLLVNLTTRGLGKAATVFYKSFSVADQDCIIFNDENTIQSEWDLITTMIVDDGVTSKIITQRSLKLGIEEENYNQRNDFEFYS